MRRKFSDTDTVSAALYPVVFREFIRFREEYGIVRQLPTRIFFKGPKVGEEFEVELERGNKAFFRVLAISDPSEAGERKVLFSVNGQIRSVVILDKNASQVVCLCCLCVCVCVCKGEIFAILRLASFPRKYNTRENLVSKFFTFRVCPTVCRLYFH